MLNEISTIEKLNVLKKLFLPLIPTLTAIRNKSNTPTLKIKTSQTSPTNKKIIPQRRLYSTKKPRKVLDKVLETPSRTEQNHISASLIFKNNTTMNYDL